MDSPCEYVSGTIIGVKCGGITGCVNDEWLEKNGSASRLMWLFFISLVC